MYKFRSVGRPTNLNLAGVYFIPEYFSNNQTRGGRAGQPIGAPNYRNDILIGIVKLYLPQGLEAWREVAVAYQRESMEATLCRGGTFGTTGTGSATACRSRKVSPVSYPTVSFVERRISG